MKEISMHRQLLLAASGLNELQTNILVAIGAATFTTFGAFVVQYYLAKLERKNDIDDKRLEALVQMREKVEYARGYWYGWADNAAQPNAHYNEPEMSRTAADAMNAAWYAITLFDMYFPTFRQELDQLRTQLQNDTKIAERQIEEKVFDPDEFNRDGDIVKHLDALVTAARDILDLPKR
jgi:hypothetical protein